MIGEADDDQSKILCKCVVRGYCLTIRANLILLVIFTASVACELALLFGSRAIIGLAAKGGDVIDLRAGGAERKTAFTFTHPILLASSAGSQIATRAKPQTSEPAHKT